jgi:hypothetical protein
MPGATHAVTNDTLRDELFDEFQNYTWQYRIKSVPKYEDLLNRLTRMRTTIARITRDENVQIARRFFSSSIRAHRINLQLGLDF